MWWAGVLEVVLGGLVAVGMFARPAAFVASGMMAVAYFWRHIPDSFWPSVNGGETAVLYCFVFLLLVFTGPGSLAASQSRYTVQWLCSKGQAMSDDVTHGLARLTTLDA